MITRKLEPLLEAQIANAIGISHFLLRNKTTGKFERITDPDEIERAINEGEELQRAAERSRSETSSLEQTEFGGTHRTLTLGTSAYMRLTSR
jgi:hypothetical protein